MPSNKSLRTAIVTHLFQMHGRVTMRPGQRMSLSALEELHDILHMDDYACPPHTHKDGAVKLKLGELYVDNLIIELGEGNGEDSR